MKLYLFSTKKRVREREKKYLHLFKQIIKLFSPAPFPLPSVDSYFFPGED